MFEAAELGQTVSKAEFKEREPQLQTELLELQRRLRESNTPVIIVVEGVEGAGKGEVVNLLNTWLDTRGVETHAFLKPTKEEKRHPRFWRFWRQLPKRGRIAVLFGSWYTSALIERVHGKISEDAFDHELQHIRLFERLLTDDGYLLIKFWFHLAQKEQKRRAKNQKKREKSLYLSPFIGKYAKHYEEYLAASQRAIRLSDAGHAPWQLVEATDKRFRNLTLGTRLAQAIHQHLDAREQRPPISETPAHGPEIPEGTESILDQVDLSARLERKEYSAELDEAQRELNHWVGKAWKAKRSLVAVFEGWDAAGKGGVIRRASAALDARLMRVVPVSSPTDEELAHHYLWRFWRRIPPAGTHVIFDRSWYGRILVERVEQLASTAEWQRAFQEINEFEEQLVEHGSILVKFWLHISPEEQFRRFKRREETPWKRHKITDEDWRNREKWDLYKEAVNEMVFRTGTEFAPWHLVPSENKRFARVFVIKEIIKALESALG